MKNLGIVALFFLSSLFTTQISASADSADHSGETSQLRTELNSFIQSIDLKSFDLEDGDRVTIEFMVNADSEIVVMKTDSPELDQAIKRKLNYKKVDTDEVRRNQKYILPIVLKK